MTQDTTTVEIRENAHETTPVFAHSPAYGGVSRLARWGWPDEADLATFTEEADQAVKTDRMKQPDRTLENDTEYAALYFVS